MQLNFKVIKKVATPHFYINPPLSGFSSLFRKICWYPHPHPLKVTQFLEGPTLLSPPPLNKRGRGVPTMGPHGRTCSVESMGSDVAILRNSKLMLNVMFSNNAERSFYCEKLNYIISSYLGLFRSSHPQPSIFKIFPENTGGRVLLLVKLQTYFLEQWLYTKGVHQECFLRNLLKAFGAPKYHRS